MKRHKSVKQLLGIVIEIDQ